MANKDNANGFSLAKSLLGQMVPISLPLAASQTIAKGDAVIFSSGLVAIALSSSPQLLGIAAEDGSSDASPVRADDRILIYPAIPGAIFEGQCSGDSTAALVGTAVDIEGTTGIMEVNENSTNEDVIQIVGLVSDDREELALGTNDRVYFVILRSAFRPTLADK